MDSNFPVVYQNAIVKKEGKEGVKLRENKLVTLDLLFKRSPVL